MMNSFQASAQSNCSPDVIKPKKTYNFPGRGYWMQAGSDKFMTFTAPGGVDGQLFMLEGEGKSVPTMSSEIDPFPTPEGDLVIQPGYNEQTGDDQLNFFGFDEISQKGRDAKPLFGDKEMKGNYQSIGQLSKSGSKRNFRVLMGSGTGQIQDYEIKKEGSRYKFKKMYSDPVKVCSNILSDPYDLQTPVLSRDGKYFSAVDYKTDTTKIYKLSMPSGHCKVEKDLGVRTDKVSFSFDGKRYSYRENVQGPYGDWVTTIKIGNIETGEVVTVSPPGEDSFYHTWFPNGDFAYTAPDKIGDFRTELRIFNGNEIPNFNGCEAPPANPSQVRDNYNQGGKDNPNADYKGTPNPDYYDGDKGTVVK